MRKIVWVPLVLAAALAVLVSCASSPPPAAKAPAQPAKADRADYEGAGKAASMLEAMNQAKMDAVRQAVIDLIGVGNEQANRQKLEQVLYNTKNPNAYIFTDTFEATRKDKVGDDYIIEAKMAVNLASVENTLKAQGLMGGEATAAAAAGPAGAGETPQGETPKAAAGSGGGEPGKQPATATEVLAEVTAPAGPVDLTTEEKNAIARYVNNLTYMVYFTEGAEVDPFYMKTAVNIANEYLATNALEAIDLDQIERLKKDQSMAYEEETGKSMTMIQWLAQKLNADVYIEIDGRTTGESSGGKYYGQANITLKAFEASTGRLQGSQPWNSPKTISSASEQAARINALQTSVYKAMPVVINQAKAYMAKALVSGIKYELIVQNTPDAKMMTDFRRKLARKVKDVETVSQSADQTRFNVYLIGSVEDLVDAIYDTAETVPGLEGMEQVLLRGKSVTFNSRM
jgi:hypothetical protein